MQDFFCIKKEKKNQKEVECIIYAMTTKTYQIKYHEMSTLYLYISNSLNLTKKTKLFFLRKAKFNKERQKKTRENLSHF